MRLFRHQYYLLKPYLPWRLRMAVRRWTAKRKLAKCRDIWPIKPGTETPPQNWPGWPDGKKFAVVLTHDVEGPQGLARVKQLAELEMKLGFRSSFNFIPEGDYRVPKDLRDWLTGNGFEVGVHDLYHDGKLYTSREAFRRHAQKINHYLKEWDAVGFRSGFMHHNLDWLHDLNIEYDASTFDTDPFEPQPDGANTIFPFWVENGRWKIEAGRPQKTEDGRPISRLPSPISQPHLPSPISHLPASAAPRRGYIELPYTLPQDSTIFTLFERDSIEIWKTKLDWIVEHDGMALLNVHPDFVCFDGPKNDPREVSCEQYESFLHHIKAKFSNSYWNTLPKEITAWLRRARESRAKKESLDAALGLTEMAAGDSKRNGSLQKKRAAVVLYSYYASDPRPRRAAEALLRAGMEVDVICLRRNRSLSWNEKIDGVNVFRVPLKRRRSSTLTYALQYTWFFLVSFLVLSLRTIRNRYDLVHVHNMPDFLVFTSIFPRLLGAKVILDLHDPMPEVFSSIFGVPEEHYLIRCLKVIEKLSARFADLILTPNIAFKEIFAARSCGAEKIQLVMNSPQETIFNLQKCVSKWTYPQESKPFTIMYHGLLVERHGLDLAIRAVADLRERIPNLKFHIYGEQTEYVDQMMALVKELRLESVVNYHNFKPLAKIAEAISTIDLGLVPNRLTPFTRVNLPTRIFEYLSMEKPVIVPRTKGIQDYFGEDEMIFFQPEDIRDLARKIEWVYLHPSATRQVVAKGKVIYEQHRWQFEEKHLIGLVEGLLKKEAAVPRKRICMLAYSNYETDNRVIRYAEGLAKRGDTVDVFALKANRRQARAETIRDVRLCRVQTRPRKNEQSKAAYLLPLLKFWLLSSTRITWRHLRYRYDLVHVHNVPDFLVFAAWLPKLTGAKLILDIHDIVPEFYASKFRARSNSTAISALKRIERASARFADRIIISNHLWLDLYATRTGANGKCSVFINNVDANAFRPRPRTRHDGKLIIMFPGGLQWHQGLDIAIQAFGKIRKELPNAEFHIYGDGNMKDSLVGLCKSLHLNGSVRFFNPVPVREIADAMANADLGVVPKRADSFGNEAYSTKIMEFMSLGVPVVASSTKIDRYYFDDSVLRFFESGNPDALAAAMLSVIRDGDSRQNMVKNASDYAARNSWDTKKQEYLDLVDSLITRP